jgi:hypothetical protein
LARRAFCCPTPEELVANNSYNRPPVVFEPSQFRELGHVFDVVWALVQTELGSAGVDLQAARDRLAAMVLELAADHQLDAAQVASTAVRRMREEVLCKHLEARPESGHDD